MVVSLMAILPFGATSRIAARFRYAWAPEVPFFSTIT